MIYMPINVTIQISDKILNRLRPQKFDKHSVTINALVLDQQISIVFQADVYICPKNHNTYLYHHKDEQKAVIVTCAHCGADAQCMTLKWRWEYHADYTMCRGCERFWNFKDSKHQCAATCPYELIGHSQTYGGMY